MMAMLAPAFGEHYPIHPWPSLKAKRTKTIPSTMLNEEKPSTTIDDKLQTGMESSMMIGKASTAIELDATTMIYLPDELPED